MNEIEVGRILAFAAAQDPKMPQGDPDGFIRRTWTTILNNVPPEMAQRAVVAYYSGDHYATTRDPIVPAVIVQWTNARRRPTEQERTGHNHATQRELPAPPPDPDRIRRGLDQVIAALVQKRSIAAGEDPELAADIAEGEASARREIRNHPCTHCKAKPGQPCVNHRGDPLTKTQFHDSRINPASENTTPRTSAARARAEVLARAGGGLAGVDGVSVDL